MEDQFPFMELLFIDYFLVIANIMHFLSHCFA